MGIETIFTLTVGSDVFKITHKNAKYQVLHNDKKMAEFTELRKATDKANEIAAPYEEKWRKLNKTSQTT